jgi:hypothetical protein
MVFLAGGGRSIPAESFNTQRISCKFSHARRREDLLASNSSRSFWIPSGVIDIRDLVKDGVRKAIRDRQVALADLVHAIREYQRIAESKPLTLQGEDYAHAVLELNKAVDRAEGFLQ